MLKLSAGRANCFLLESVEGGAVRGRYSIIGIEPDLIFRVRDRKAELNTEPASGLDYAPLAEPPLDGAAHADRGFAPRIPEGLPPMAAGIFGYLGYDMVREMEALGAAEARTRSAFPTRS